MVVDFDGVVVECLPTSDRGGPVVPPIGRWLVESYHDLVEYELLGPDWQLRCSSVVQVEEVVGASSVVPPVLVSVLAKDVEEVLVQVVPEVFASDDTT